MKPVERLEQALELNLQRSAWERKLMDGQFGSGIVLIGVFKLLAKVVDVGESRDVRV